MAPPTSVAEAPINPLDHILPRASSLQQEQQQQAVQAQHVVWWQGTLKIRWDAGLGEREEEAHARACATHPHEAVVPALRALPPRHDPQPVVLQQEALQSAPAAIRDAVTSLECVHAPRTARSSCTAAASMPHTHSTLNPWPQVAGRGARPVARGAGPGGAVWRQAAAGPAAVPEVRPSSYACCQQLQMNAWSTCNQAGAATRHPLRCRPQHAGPCAPSQTPSCP